MHVRSDVGGSVSVQRITKGQALRAARARLPILGDKALQQNLECITDSLAEAYRIGAEEAQQLIVRRIDAIGNKVSKSHTSSVAVEDSQITGGDDPIAWAGPPKIQPSHGGG